MSENTPNSGRVPLKQQQPENLDELMRQAARRLRTGERFHRIEHTGPGPLDWTATPLTPAPERKPE